MQLTITDPQFDVLNHLVSNPFSTASSILLAMDYTQTKTSSDNIIQSLIKMKMITTKNSVLYYLTRFGNIIIGKIPAPRDIETALISKGIKLPLKRSKAKPQPKTTSQKAPQKPPTYKNGRSDIFLSEEFMRINRIPDYPYFNSVNKNNFTELNNESADFKPDYKVDHRLIPIFAVKELVRKPMLEIKLDEINELKLTKELGTGVEKVQKKNENNSSLLSPLNVSDSIVKDDCDAALKDTLGNIMVDPFFPSLSLEERQIMLKIDADKYTLKGDLGLIYKDYINDDLWVDKCLDGLVLRGWLILESGKYFLSEMGKVTSETEVISDPFIPNAKALNLSRLDRIIIECMISHKRRNANMAELRIAVKGAREKATPFEIKKALISLKSMGIVVVGSNRSYVIRADGFAKLGKRTMARENIIKKMNKNVIKKSGTEEKAERALATIRQLGVKLNSQNFTKINNIDEKIAVLTSITEFFEDKDVIDFLLDIKNDLLQFKDLT